MYHPPAHRTDPNGPFGLQSRVYSVLGRHIWYWHDIFRTGPTYLVLARRTGPTYLVLARQPSINSIM